MQEYWSQYWQQGHLTSFSLDIKDNYQGCLLQLWEDFFSKCEPEANVLDIGTGNGALIDIGVSTNSKLRLFGIDYAKLNVPENLKKISSVDIQQKVNAEDLPFSAQSFDYIISQFGIEYADLSRALPELNRVLKKNGRFQLVVHDVSSSIVKPNTDILFAANALLKEGGGLHCLEQLFIALAREGKESNKTEACRLALNHELKHIAQDNEAGLLGCNFSVFLRVVMSSSLSLQQRQEKLSLFKNELEGLVERLSDLSNAAFTEKKYQQCLEMLISLGLTVVKSYMLIENDMKVARVINGSK